ncbi:MAG: photolyase, partial [Actinomycetota bacterium]
MSSIFWFRRDLRLQDNEALVAAFSEPGGVAGVYKLVKADYLSLEGIRQHS